MLTHYNPTSSNRKTGAIPVTVSPSSTCPTSCPFKDAGCYADSGPLRLLWNRVNTGTAGISWKRLLASIQALPEGQLWRHNAAGDLPGTGDRINGRQLLQLARANRGRQGFTFTHKPPTPENLAHIRAAREMGFAINLSANNLEHADTLADTGLPVVAVLPKDTTGNTTTPAGRRVVICPGVTHGRTCADCKLCARNRSVIVGFPAHGTRARAASAIASNA